MLDKLTQLSDAVSNSDVSRRAFLGRVAALGAAGFLAACGGDDEAVTADEDVLTAEGEAAGAYPVVNAETCAGYDALDEQAIATRNALAYQDDTPEEGEYCGNCRFKADYAEDSNCLGCTLFAGPVSPGGWCQSWAALA